MASRLSYRRRVRRAAAAVLAALSLVIAMSTVTAPAQADL